jgi:tRNA nucleotidyltransferase (CCA-adding enzyme)
MNTFQHILDDPRTRTLGQVLAPHGKLFLVGGSVRDALMGKNSKDLDFAFSEAPDKIIPVLEKAGIRVIPTGLSHQTVTVKLDENLPHVEITSFRNAHMNPAGGVYLGSTIEEDLSCRDFTINALALPVTIENHLKGESLLLDPLGGFDDLKNKIIRTPGNPKDRFSEDPLRILRMARFASVFDFVIDPSTLSAAIALSMKITSVSPERIRDEFIKILVSDYPGKGLNLLKDLGFYKMFIPEIDACIDFEQNRFHKHDVFIHTIEVVEKSPKDPLVRLSAFFHDIGKPPSLSVDDQGERHFYLHEKIGAEMIPEIARRLRFSNELTAAIRKMVHTHMRPLDAGPGGLRRILRDTEPFYEEWRALKYADTAAVLGDTSALENDFRDFDERIVKIKEKESSSPYRKLAIDGADLIELGLQPGPRFKEILSFLHEKVLDQPECNTREQLIGLLRDNFKIDC